MGLERSAGNGISKRPSQQRLGTVERIARRAEASKEEDKEKPGLARNTLVQFAICIITLVTLVILVYRFNVLLTSTTGSAMASSFSGQGTS